MTAEVGELAACRRPGADGRGAEGRPARESLAYREALIVELIGEVGESPLRDRIAGCHGADQGEAPWSGIDEVVTWTAAMQLTNDCPLGPYNPGPNPVPDHEWWLYPMAFVSCDPILETPALAATYLGTDHSGYFPTEDGC